jgi:hypothetical protein
MMEVNMEAILNILKEIKVDIGELKEDVGGLKVDVGGLKVDVGELKVDVGELKANMLQLNTDVGGLKEDVCELKVDVSKLKTDFAKNEPNFKKAGTTYELIVLHSLREKRGSDYARSFIVENLHGLARLALPKDVTYSDNKFKCHNASNIPFHDVDKVHLLATHAFKNHDTFSTWLSNNKLRSEQKTVSKADKEWKSKYVRADNLFSKYSNLNIDEKMNFLKSTALGLWMFSIDSYEGYLSIVIIIVLYNILTCSLCI